MGQTFSIFLHWIWYSFFSTGLQVHMGEIDNGKQREWGHNSGQNNYTIIFVSRKSNFYGHFQSKNSFHFYIVSFKRTYINRSLANFNRAASSHKQL